MSWEAFFVFLAWVVVVGAVIFTVDDLFIDLTAFFRRLAPRIVTAQFLADIKGLKQKRFAILIANWKEADVLAPMIRGNLRGLQYENYRFFLGVYPNDTETWMEAKKLEDLYPHRVTVIVNSQQGPTSKGQMLNEMARQIVSSEVRTLEHYDLFLLQDSEDVLHPHSLSLMNAESAEADFIQIPVFSFNVPTWSLVGGVYIDEFSESHSKDLLVREALGAAIPSAGVGTALSHDLLVAMQAYQSGQFLKEDTLTEDYHLGIMAKELGFKSKFACVQYEKEDGTREFIATREYFPARFQASLRQKSRWVLGIAFQGLENLKWNGSLVDKYFLWRDRRGPMNSILVVCSVVILLMLFTLRLTESFPAVLEGWAFQVFVGLNMLNMSMRLFQRMRAVAKTNARRHIWMVPIRWLVANAVNLGATVIAYNQYRESRRTGQRPAWIKTEHRLPENFGKEMEVQSL